MTPSHALPIPTGCPTGTCKAAGATGETEEGFLIGDGSVEPVSMLEEAPAGWDA